MSFLHTSCVFGAYYLTSQSHGERAVLPVLLGLKCELRMLSEMFSEGGVNCAVTTRRCFADSSTVGIRGSPAWQMPCLESGGKYSCQKLCWFVFDWSVSAFPGAVDVRPLSPVSSPPGSLSFAAFSRDNELVWTSCSRGPSLIPDSPKTGVVSILFINTGFYSEISGLRSAGAHAG